MSLNVQIQNSIAIVEWDQAGSSANVIRSDFLKEFESLVKELMAKKIKVLLFKSAKPHIFIAGADIKEIQSLESKQKCQELIEQAHKILLQFEQAPFKKIALIHGACLGGGTEFTLAFDIRLASDSPVTKIGLPEVQLGLIPGFGGCVRLPRQIGLIKSLEMILTGKALPSQKAYRWGLVHEVMPPTFLQKRGMDLAQKWVEGKEVPLKKYKPKGLLNIFLESFLGRSLVYSQSQSKVLKQTKGFFPAPLKALEVVKKASRLDLESALKIETSGFCQMALTPESKNLIRLFFLMDAIKKKKSPMTGDSSSEEKIKRVGVLGAGVMGGGIAYLCGDKNYKVRIKDIQAGSLSTALTQAHRLWEKQKKQKRVNLYQWKEREAHLSTALHYHGFSSLDCVIEAVTEDAKIKKSVIKECAQHLTESTLFASNTSSLSIETLSQSYPWPENFVGMHFFNPAYKMPLVEIIKTTKTSAHSLEKIFQFAKSLGKVPIVVKDSPGFVVNRILIPYLTEALWLLHDGNTVKEIDHSFTHHFGLPMGPLRLMDEVGLDVCLKIINIFKESGLDVEIPSWTPQIEKTLGLGRKTKKGFYIYQSKNVIPNQELSDLISPVKNSISQETRIKRGIYRLINEAFKVWDENLTHSPEDIDLALILGIGFPPFLGGPIQYAQSLGWESIHKTLEDFNKNWGKRFKPTSAFSNLKSPH